MTTNTDQNHLLSLSHEVTIQNKEGNIVVFLESFIFKIKLLS